MNISHSIIILFVLSLLLAQQNITAQNVIDNEVLSGDNDDEGNSNADDVSNPNEFSAKPLVHVSIEGTEINDKIRGGDGNDIISGEDGQGRHPRRRPRVRPGGEDLQQHASGRDHGRHLRDLRHGAEARPRPASFLRHQLQGVGPELVDDVLLPGPRRRAGNARRPRL